MRAFAAAAFCSTILISVPSAPLRALEQASAAPAPSPGLIDGIVTDSTLAPIEGATVTIFQTNIRVTTGSSGRFRIRQIPAGQFLLIVQRLGFRPASGIVEVPASDTVRLAYTLERTVVQLTPTVVTEKHLTPRLAEFETRRRLGEGQFITQEAIDASSAPRLTELVRAFSGVYVAPLRGSIFQYVAMSTRMGACPLVVYLDGQRQTPPVDLDVLVSPKEVAGIEVYLGPGSTPLQYAGRDTGCGVLLVWTRGG